MKRQIRILVAGAILAFAAQPVLAQDAHSGHGAASDSFPEVCRSDAETPPTAHSDADMGSMSDHQKESMAAMMKMDADMMQGMMKEDADVAFVCGMIAHHQGAIDMAEIELEHGDDDWAKEMARKVIDAQAREIAEMTGWLAKNAE